jgi:hypothetical protein
MKSQPLEGNYDSKREFEKQENNKYDVHTLKGAKRKLENVKSSKLSGLRYHLGKP